MIDRSETLVVGLRATTEMLRDDVRIQAARLLEAGHRRLWIGGRWRINRILNVVAVRRAVEAGGLAHLIGDGVIGAGCVAADAEPADHVARLVERHAAAESDDAAGDIAEAGSLRLKLRIEWIGVVQSVQRPAGLRRPVEHRGREREIRIAEIIRRARLGDGDRAAARPGVAGLDHGAKNALTIDDGGPHQIGLEETAIAALHDRRQLFLDVLDRRRVYAAS